MHKHNFIMHIVKYTVNRRKKQAKNQGRERLVLIYAITFMQFGLTVRLYIRKQLPCPYGDTHRKQKKINRIL